MAGFRLGDVALNDLNRTGLPVASVIRTAKIATIVARDADRLGRVPAAILRSVDRHLARGMRPVG